MNADLQQLSNAVINYVTEKKRSNSTLSAYHRCFSKLATYLDEKEVVYTPDEARQWLTSISNTTNKSDISLFQAAINKLNDLYIYGEIHKSHYDPSKTISGKLCPEFSIIQAQFLEHISDLAEETVSTHSWQCASILLRFQDAGVNTVNGITYAMLLDEFNSSSENTRYSKATHHTNLRMLLQFLYDKKRVPYGFTLFVNAMNLRKGDYWNRMSKAQITGLRLQQDGMESNLDDFLEMRDDIYNQHSEEHYSKSSLNGIIRITNLLYLFMDMNQLCYSPTIGNAWLESVKPFWDSIEYKHFRRVICLLEQKYNDKQLRLNSYFVFRKTIYKCLPEWCRQEVNSFLQIKSGEGWSPSTMRMYKHCICRFCISIDAMGVKSFKNLSPWDIKQFNLSDMHDTPEGKNAYNSRIRQFLLFLGENQISDNPFLFVALPCVNTSKETLVITLTEDEQSELRHLFTKENATISLREKAMLQLGLYMGIRQSDIICLTIDDIDWDNATIRISQNKTGYEVILPMPTPVANALFRYIMKERPATDSRSIFIRKYAPFEQVGRNACYNALNSAMPERHVPGSGFHVMRKTYATNLLRNDVPVQHVAEALGHQGMDAVHKYLALEETRMRQCGLSLHDKMLSIKGGLCHA